MSESRLCETSAEGMANLVNMLDELKTSDSSENSNTVTTTFVFGSKDLILYALGGMKCSIVFKRISYV